ncbi:MAG: hypothetical protein J6N67_01955, partial [Desulfovibrio sp.]|nr:hypothetical protein [Desulfovibrio sp.]
LEKYDIVLVCSFQCFSVVKRAATHSGAGSERRTASIATAAVTAAAAQATNFQYTGNADGRQSRIPPDPQGCNRARRT